MANVVPPVTVAKPMAIAAAAADVVAAVAGVASPAKASQTANKRRANMTTPRRSLPPTLLRGMRTVASRHRGNMHLTIQALR